MDMFTWLRMRTLLKDYETRIKELEAKNHEKSEFLSMMAHQLRTHLSATKWAYSMMLSGDFGALTAEQRDVLNKGNQSNEHMIAMLREIISAHRADSFGLHLAIADADLGFVIKHAIDEFDSLAHSKNITVTYTPTAGALLHIDGDRDKIGIALQNLLENAIKYNKQGGRVTIKAYPADDNTHLAIDVTDTGIGIPKKEREQLFGKFFRASNAQTYTKGTGLGLFIAKRIIEEHHGSLSCESEEGRGTTFTIKLPLKNKNL
jgi:signal transduction histidine kinase